MSTIGYALLSWDDQQQLLAKSSEDFWRELPEAVAIALSKACPTHAGPWAAGARFMTRKSSLGGMAINTMIEKLSDDCFVWYPELLAVDGPRFSSLAEAQAAVDAHLRANGWLLEGEAAK